MLILRLKLKVNFNDIKSLLNAGKQIKPSRLREIKYSHSK